MKNIEEKQLSARKDQVTNSIQTLYDNTDLDNPDDVKRSYNYFDWINTKTQIIKNEKNFVCNELESIVRGSVVWVEFGFNIGREFGGKHPAIVLRRTGDSVFVVPLSSQEPTNPQKYHVKVEKVYGFKNIVRWTNVLKIQNVSIQRIDFNASIGNVKGCILNNINDALKVSHIF